MTAIHIPILKATLTNRPDAELLLHEYYDTIEVIKRDSPEEIAAYLSEDASCLWIGYVQNEPAGCVALRPLAVHDHAAECKRLYVRPQFRGLGIAHALLDAMEEHAGTSGIEWIYLDSKDDLRDALRLYSHRGYEGCERYNDNPQATIFMRKKLGCSKISAQA